MTLEDFLIGFLIGILLAQICLYWLLATGKLNKLWDWLDALCDKFK